MKFASFLVVILTIQKPDSYSALASSLVRIGRSDSNTNTETGFSWVSKLITEYEANFIKLHNVKLCNTNRPIKCTFT